MYQQEKKFWVKIGDLFIYLNALLFIKFMYLHAGTLKFTMLTNSAAFTGYTITFFPAMLTEAAASTWLTLPLSFMMHAETGATTVYTVIFWLPMRTLLSVKGPNFYLIQAHSTVLGKPIIGFVEKLRGQLLMEKTAIADPCLYLSCH